MTFQDFKVDDVYINAFNSNGIEFDQETFQDSVDRLVTWVYTDFNFDHKDGRVCEKLNPILRFIIGLFKLTAMSPWQWMSYLYNMASDVPFYFAPSLVGGSDDWKDKGTENAEL